MIFFDILALVFLVVSIVHIIYAVVRFIKLSKKSATIDEGELFMTNLKYNGLATYHYVTAKDGKIYRYFDTNSIDRRLYLKDDAFIVGAELVPEQVYEIIAHCEATISSRDTLFLQVYACELKA